jgi:hypothetical protein
MKVTLFQAFLLAAIITTTAALGAIKGRVLEKGQKDRVLQKKEKGKKTPPPLKEEKGKKTPPPLKVKGKKTPPPVDFTDTLCYGSDTFDVFYFLSTLDGTTTFDDATKEKYLTPLVKNINQLMAPAGKKTTWQELYNLLNPTPEQIAVAKSLNEPDLRHRELQLSACDQKIVSICADIGFSFLSIFIFINPRHFPIMKGNIGRIVVSGLGKVKKSGVLDKLRQVSREEAYAVFAQLGLIVFKSAGTPGTFIDGLTQGLDLFSKIAIGGSLLAELSAFILSGGFLAAAKVATFLLNVAVLGVAIAEAIKTCQPPAPAPAAPKPKPK